MAASRRTILLAAAVGVAVVVALIWTSGGPSATSAPAQTPRPAAARAQGQGSAESEPGVAQVNLAALTAPRDEPVDAARNPFRFQQRAPAPAPPSSGGSFVPPPMKPMNQTPPPFVPPPPSGPPPPPPIPLKFIGIVQQGNKRVAVLTDGKSGPQSGEEGAIILGQYQILKIGNESIEMAYFDGRGRQTIRLTGQ
jgi:hypothetical protein